MAWLTARFLAAFAPLRCRLRMGMLGAGGQRRIAWRLVQTRFEFGDLRQQQANDSLRLRRLTGDQLFRDQQFLRHAPGVAEIADLGKINSPTKLNPARERLRRNIAGGNPT
jgi:hypothetical protein